MSSGRVVGVDGWSGGWVTVTLDGDRASVAHHPTFADVLIARPAGAELASFGGVAPKTGRAPTQP